jgi:hypothetical protein
MPAELRAELVAHKQEVLQHLHAEQGQGRWNPLVPTGWTPEAWHGRLLFLADRCWHADRAAALREWAEAVESVYGAGREVSE